MTKEEVFNYILVNTNQYFVGAENFEIKEPILDGLLWKALNIWGEYNPIYVISPVLISAPKMKLSHIEDNFGVKRLINGITGIYFQDYTRVINNEIAKDAYKVYWDWKYDAVQNALYTPIETPELFYIECLCVPTLEDVNYNDNNFLELMVGLALDYIGHNRTDFALGELPFDIKDLSDIGVEKINQVKENLAGSSDGWVIAASLF